MSTDLVLFRCKEESSHPELDPRIEGDTDCAWKRRKRQPSLP